MTAEKEIAGFVLPFTLGAALILALEPSLSTSSTCISSAAISASVAGLCALIHPAHKELDSIHLWAIIIGLGLCCGILCSTQGMWYSYGELGSSGWISETASTFGEKMKAEIASIPFKDAAANSIISALITGDRTGLESETIETFRASGASHILALSGMHLGIIYGILKALFYLLGNTRYSKATKSAIIIAICGFYTLSTGAGPSIVRAFIFILIAETAVLLNRSRNLKGILFISLLIQLTICPGDIKSIGFQLSYAAVAGIAFIFPPLQNLWSRKDDNEGLTSRILRRIWTSAALSIACQVTTAPIAYAYFGTFPQYFLITNLIAAPLVMLIIPSGLLVTFLNCCGLCPEFLIDATEILINTLTWSLGVIASLSN